MEGDRKPLVHYYDVVAFELNENPEPGSGHDYRAMCSSCDRGICKVSWRADWVNCPECLSLLESFRGLPAIDVDMSQPTD